MSGKQDMGTKEVRQNQLLGLLWPHPLYTILGYGVTSLFLNARGCLDLVPQMVYYGLLDHNPFLSNRAPKRQEDVLSKVGGTFGLPHS
jgi:hypothetical protein